MTMSNELTNREIKILKILFEAKDYVNCDVISTKIGKSKKTIRNNIQEINNKTLDYGFLIISKPNNGYKLEIQNYDDLNYFISNYNDEIHDYYIRKERTRFYEIASFLLIQTDDISIKKIQNEFYYNKNILLNELKNIEHTFNNFALKLQINNDKIHIIGTTYHKKLLLAFLIRTKRYNQKVYEVIFKNYNESELADKIAEIIHTELRNYSSIELSKQNFDIIVYYLLISFYFEDNNLTQKSLNIPAQYYKDYAEEYALATTVHTQLFSKLNKALNKNEIDVLFVLFVTSVYPKTINDLIYNKNLNLIKQTIKILEKYTSISFANDTFLIHYLYSFFYAKEIRDQYSCYSMNIPTLKYKRKRIIYIELAYKIYKELLKDFPLVYTEKEVLFFSMCFTNIFAKIDLSMDKQKIAILSQYGIIESMRYLEGLKLHYPSLFEMCHPISYSDFMQLNEKQVIITDIKNLKTTNTTFYIDAFSQYSEFSRILSLINKKNKNDCFLDISKDNIISNLDIKDKNSAITYVTNLTNAIAKKKIIAVEAMKLQDDELSYEIGNHIALIHMENNLFNEPKMYFLVLNSTILWKVNYVKLIIIYYSSSNFIDYRYLGENFSKFISSPKKVNTFIKEKTFESIEKYLYEKEE